MIHGQENWTYEDSEMNKLSGYMTCYRFNSGKKHKNQSSGVRNLYASGISGGLNIRLKNR